jgi:formaldehyde-activating enzyme involved in methanogenesis
MNESDLKSGINGVNKTLADWDVDTIVEQIWNDLKGAVARSVIQDVLVEVVPRYEQAQIQTFVPIFIRRDAVDQLKAMQALFATPAMATNEADGRNESRAN